MAAAYLDALNPEQRQAVEHGVEAGRAAPAAPLLIIAGFKLGDFEMEWPPRSRRRARFPELDRLAYFGGGYALTRILTSQAPLVAEVLAFLGERT